MKERWHSTIALVMVALTLGFVLGRSSVFPRAEAQGEATAGRVAALLGSPASSGQTVYAPIVVVDSLQQSLMIYEYSYRSRSIELKAARTFRWDKEIVELNNGTGGPSVKQVQAMLNRP